MRVPLLKLRLQKEMWIEGNEGILNVVLSMVNFMCLCKTQVAITGVHL